MKDDSILWNKLCEADAVYIEACGQFFVNCKQHKIVIKEALSTPSRRSTALRFLLFYLDAEDRIEFFEQLVTIASSAHCDIELCRKVILTLPKDFVLANIEQVSEPLLLTSDPVYQYEEYRRLLELYIEIDRDITERLASRASQGEIEEIREAGEDFLALLADRNE
jgi:hypothetical protein